MKNQAGYLAQLAFHGGVFVKQWVLIPSPCTWLELGGLYYKEMNAVN